MCDLQMFFELMMPKYQDRDPRAELLRNFKLFDVNDTGRISVQDIKRVVKELGETLTDEEIREIIDEADKDGDGCIREEHFIRFMKKTNLY